LLLRILGETARADFDVPFRYGGEEIGLILPNTDSEKAFQIAERIRMSVSSKRFEGVPTITTISIGLATYPDHASDLESLIKEADEALYYSKKTGKNKTTIAGVRVLLNESNLSNQEVRDLSKNDNDKSDKSHDKSLTDVNLKKEFKLPSFCDSYENFINYYNSIKAKISNIKLVSVISDLDNYEKILYDVHFNLLLTESISAKLIDNNEVEIKILLVERSDKEIQDLINSLKSKFNVKIS
jgi:hypothetical protein